MIVTIKHDIGQKVYFLYEGCANLQKIDRTQVYIGSDNVPTIRHEFYTKGFSQQPIVKGEHEVFATMEELRAGIAAPQ